MKQATARAVDTITGTLVKIQILPADMPAHV